LSSEVYGAMVTVTAPTEPEADTEERRTTVLYRSEETNVIDPITEGTAGLTKGETCGPSW